MRCETIQLDDGHARLTVAEEGGAILGYDALQAGAAPLPLMKLAENGKAFGCQVLVPFSNRISGGGFTFDGRSHAIEPNVPGEAFPIHGDGFQKPWRVVSSSPTDLVHRGITRARRLHIILTISRCRLLLLRAGIACR